MLPQNRRLRIRVSPMARSAAHSVWHELQINQTQPARDMLTPGIRPDAGFQGHHLRSPSTRGMSRLDCFGLLADRLTARPTVLRPFPKPRPQADPIDSNAEQIGWDKSKLRRTHPNDAKNGAVNSSHYQTAPSLAPYQNRRKHRQTTREIIQPKHANTQPLRPV